MLQGKVEVEETSFVRDLNKYKLFPLPTVKQTCARIVRAPFFKDYYKKYFYPNKQFDEYLEINRFYKVVCREIRKSKYDQSFYIILTINFIYSRRIFFEYSLARRTK